MWDQQDVNSPDPLWAPAASPAPRRPATPSGNITGRNDDLLADDDHNKKNNNYSVKWNKA